MMDCPYLVCPSHQQPTQNLLLICAVYILGSTLAHPVGLDVLHNTPYLVSPIGTEYLERVQAYSVCVD